MTNSPPSFCSEAGRQSLTMNYLGFGGGSNFLGSKAELALQLFERRGGAEGLHADDDALASGVLHPSEDRSLLHRHLRGASGGMTLSR